MVKNMPAAQEIQVWFLGPEDPLEKGMVTNCSIFAWDPVLRFQFIHLNINMETSKPGSLRGALTVDPGIGDASC